MIIFENEVSYEELTAENVKILIKSKKGKIFCCAPLRGERL